MLIEFFPLLMMGFGLGAIHALDADHIMAVSVLSNQNPSFQQTLFHGVYWALGHGVVLIVCGIIVFGLGLTIPKGLQYFSELCVGGLLIVLGVFCFLQFRKEKIKLKVHKHGDIVHMHWTNELKEHENKPLNNPSTHKPVCVGILHGFAGSAPALALIPAVSHGYFIEAMAYLIIFSIGVMTSMLLFGLCFSKVHVLFRHRYQKLFLWNRHLIALSSILFGGFWLLKAL